MDEKQPTEEERELEVIINKRNKASILGLLIGIGVLIIILLVVFGVIGPGVHDPGNIMLSIIGGGLAGIATILVSANIIGKMLGVDVLKMCPTVDEVRESLNIKNNKTE